MSGHIAGALERAVVEGKMDSQNRQWRLVRRPEGLLRVEDVELRPGDADRRPLQPGQVRVRNLLFLYAPTMRHWMSARSDRLHEIIPLDRKRVVSGKGVSVRVGIGGRRIRQKKK